MKYILKQLALIIFISLAIYCRKDVALPTQNPINPTPKPIQQPRLNYIEVGNLTNQKFYVGNGIDFNGDGHDDISYYSERYTYIYYDKSGSFPTPAGEIEVNITRFKAFNGFYVACSNYDSYAKAMIPDRLVNGTIFNTSRRFEKSGCISYSERMISGTYAGKVGYQISCTGNYLGIYCKDSNSNIQLGLFGGTQSYLQK